MTLGSDVPLAMFFLKKVINGLMVSVSFQHLFMGSKKFKKQFVTADQMCCIVMTWRGSGRRKCFLAFHENRMWGGGIHQRTRRYDNAVDTARFSIIYSHSNPSRWTISLKALLNFLHPNPPPSLLTFIYWASGRFLRLTFMVLLQKILVMPTSSY